MMGSESSRPGLRAPYYFYSHFATPPCRLPKSYFRAATRPIMLRPMQEGKIFPILVPWVIFLPDCRHSWRTECFLGRRFS